MAHLGLGAFHRSHQAWFTHRASLAGDRWGIAAFTGSSTRLPAQLDAQSGAYSLLVRGPERDAVEVVGSISTAVPGTDEEAWLRVMASPDVGVLTVTVTEAGYHGTAPARIARALAARRDRGSGPIAVVACDNLPHNGEALRRAVLAAATAEPPKREAGSPEPDDALLAWIGSNVSFVSCVVDRITPATTAADVALVARLTGREDRVPVVTEPWAEWVISGSFPAGRPRWETAGAILVDDVAPYEERKLWLLNAGHSLLAYAGTARGHRTVCEAFADQTVRDRLEALWAEQRDLVALPASLVDPWLDQLRARFANPRIEHRLDQIARDGTFKLRPRIVDAIRARQDRGLEAGPEQLGVLMDWADHVLHVGPTDRPSLNLAADLSEARTPAARTDVVLHHLDRKERA